MTLGNEEEVVSLQKKIHFCFHAFSQPRGELQPPRKKQAAPCVLSNGNVGHI